MINYDKLERSYNGIAKVFGSFDFSYCDPEKKKEWHKSARRMMRLLADELGLASKSFDVRSNNGGITVSGEVTLHHERVYIQMSQRAFSNSLSLLVRPCKGRTDYSGGFNHHLQVVLGDLGVLLDLCRDILEREVAR